jgi:hypothetical protein
MLKSPLENAKTLLEDILRDVGMPIDAYQAKYVSILFANELNKNVCYATIEDNLAHAFLKNDWDRYETILSIDKCGGANITFLDSDKVTLPNFTFDDRVNAKPLPCKMEYLINPLGYTVTPSIYFQRDKKFLVHTSIYQTNKSLDFTAQTRLNFSTEDVIEIAKSLDFEGIYEKYINIYWEKNYHNYSKYLRLSFLQSIIYQFKEKSLSEKAAFLALHAVTGAKDVSVYFIGFRKFDRVAPYAFLVNPSKPLGKFIYASNIMCLENETDGHTLLYISGNSSPIHEFSNKTELAAWIITQTKNETKRRVLQSHFMLSDAEDTLLSYGLEYTLNLISTRESPELALDMIKFAGPYPSDSNFFDAMTFQIKSKSKKDVPLLIVSNKDVVKRKYFEWMDIICTIILPVALMYPQVVLFDAFFLVEGLVEVGIAIDDLKDGKNIGQKRLIFGLLNAIPAIPGAFRAPEELKTFYTSVRNHLPEEDIALLNLETEEAHELQLNTDTQVKLEANKDIGKMYYTSEATEEIEFNEEVTKNLATEGSKRSSAAEIELQHEIDAQSGKYLSEKAYPSLDIDIQASSKNYEIHI